MGCGGCASAAERCGNGLEKIYPTTAVRFGRMNHIGEFSHAPDLKFTCGAKVIVSTDRGIEVGEQVSLTCFGCDKSVNRDQMRDYAKASGGDAVRLKCGKILREADEGDLAEWNRIQDTSFAMLRTARGFSNELELEMKVVDCEHLFGGERIVFYFMAEERVDFRDLVRRLASEFQTRIEMRQIGARDEARLLADYETCGRECCCKNFLKTLKPISMSMAKIQKTTLDLSKVSGRCGRLKCCLRYEHESYESMSRKLPRVNSWIRTSHGEGRVVDRQILTQLVKIRLLDGKFITVVNEDVLETNLPIPDEARQPAVAGRGGAAERRPERGRGRETGRGGEPAAQPDRPATGDGASAEPPKAAGTSDSSTSGAAERAQRLGRGRRRRRRGPSNDTRGPGGPGQPPAGPSDGPAGN